MIDFFVSSGRGIASYSSNIIGNIATFSHNTSYLNSSIYVVEGNVEMREVKISLHGTVEGIIKITNASAKFLLSDFGGNVGRVISADNQILEYTISHFKQAYYWMVVLFMASVATSLSRIPGLLELVAMESMHKTPRSMQSMWRFDRIIKLKLLLFMASNCSSLTSLYLMILILLSSILLYLRLC